jgi:hypothetical protein
VRGQTNREKIERLMRELGRAARSPGRVYFTGGVTAVLLGWRETTLDADLKADPEPAGFFEALPKLKESLDLNIELASPEDFVPALPNWRERSQLITREGAIEFFHYDFYGQALSKIERFLKRDRFDVGRMIHDRLIESHRLLELYSSVEANVIRYPAVAAPQLRARMEAIVAGENVL